MCGLRTGNKRGGGKGRPLGAVPTQAEEPDWVLRDVSFVMEPGETIAVVGHTGAGKTTLISLLMRFYDVQRGAIRIDGVDIKEMNLDDLRGRFGVVLAGSVSVQRHGRGQHPAGDGADSGCGRGAGGGRCQPRRLYSNFARRIQRGSARTRLDALDRAEAADLVLLARWRTIRRF